MNTVKIKVEVENKGNIYTMLDENWNYENLAYTLQKIGDRLAEQIRKDKEIVNRKDCPVCENVMEERDDYWRCLNCGYCEAK